jgi:hypothetical protein
VSTEFGGIKQQTVEWTEEATTTLKKCLDEKKKWGEIFAELSNYTKAAIKQKAKEI